MVYTTIEMKGIVGTIQHSSSSVEEAAKQGWQLSEAELKRFDEYAYHDTCAIDKARWSTHRANDFRPNYPFKQVYGAALSEMALSSGHGVEIPREDLVLDLWLDIPKATDTLSDPFLLWQEWTEVNR